MIRGSVLLAACVGAWACTSDPTSDEAGKASAIEALPTAVVLKQDSSQFISFRLVDELGGTLAENWTFTNSSTLFSVTLDSTYRPVYGGSGDSVLVLPEKQTEVRATIKGLILGAGSFTVSAGGKSLSVPVSVVPGVLNATFTPANPTPGQTVTITMPPELRLTPTSVITFPGNLNPVSVVIAADSQSATFINAPTTDTTARVTNVYNTQFPTLPVATYNTAAKVTGTMSGTWNGELPSTITPPSSSGSPNGTGSLTATLAAGYAFKSTVPVSVFTFPTQTAPINAVVSADSSSVTMDIGPNVASPLQATRITFKGAPQFEYTLVSPDSVYSPVITNFPATLSNYTPQIGQSIVLTAGAGFSFNPAASIASWPLVGAALVQARTATTITLQPAPGSGGSPSAVSGVIPASSPLFQITIPAVLPTALAMQGTATALPGTADSTTAPSVAVPPVGQARGFFDAYATTPQYYKITLAATTTLRTTINWSNGADVDVAFYTDTGTFLGYFGAGTGAQPEVSTHQFAAGSYLIGPELYAGAQPAWVSINIEAVSAP